MKKLIFIFLSVMMNLAFASDKEVFYFKLDDFMYYLSKRHQIDFRESEYLEIGTIYYEITKN